MIHSLTPEQFNEKLSTLKKLKVAFDIVETSTSKYLQYGKNRYYLGKALNIPMRELYLFGQVKREAKQYMESKKDIYFSDTEFITPDVYYTSCNNTFSRPYEFSNLECIEIDLTAAYTVAAQKLGIIAKETLNKLQAASKQTRLAALGSLAKTEKRFKYDGGGVVYDSQLTESTTKTEETKPLFYQAAAEVEKIILPIMEENPDIFFYWVDALFLPPHLSKLVTSAMDKAGLKYKVKQDLKISCVLQNENLVYSVQSIDYKTGEVKTKPYTFNKHNTNTSIIHSKAAQRHLLNWIKDAKNINPKSLKEKIKYFFLTDKVKDIPLSQIQKALAARGLKLKELIKFEKRAQVVCKLHKLENGKFIELTKYALIAEYLDHLQNIEAGHIERGRVEQHEEKNYFTSNDIHIEEYF